MKNSRFTFAVAFRKSDILKRVSSIGDQETLPMTLILDNVRNPDNFGGILRAATGAGCRSVIATKGCVDPWQSKVLRAAAGAHLNIQINVDKKWNEIEQLLPPSAERQVSFRQAF